MLQWPSGVSVCGIYYDCKCLQTLLCRQIMISQIMGKTWKLEPLTSTLREHNDILLELLCPLDPLRGTLTTNQCKVVLSDHLFIITKCFYSQWSCFFQNDNAATHRAGRVTELLSEDGIDINNILWALRPQDLSLITHLWKILDLRVRQHAKPPSSKHWMRVYVFKVWCFTPAVNFQWLSFLESVESCI